MKPMRQILREKKEEGNMGASYILERRGLVFKRNKYGILGADAGDFRFQINENGDACCWVVVVKSEPNRVQRLETPGIFKTTHEAADYCGAIVEGMIDFDAEKAKWDAEYAAQDRAEVEKAKQFYAELCGVGISYEELLRLEKMQHEIGNTANAYIAAFERGEGWPEA